MAANSHIMGHSGTTRVAGTLVVLLSLLVLDATAFSPARSSVLARRSLLDSADAPRTIAVDLMHVHHVDSPYMKRRRSLTTMERLQTSTLNSKRRLQSTHVFTSPLESLPGAYIMEISLGTPTRTFKAIADTGSDLVWVQCSNSTCSNANCFQSPDLPFDPSASSTYTPLSCNSPKCGYLAIQNFELPCPSTNICTYKYGYGDLSFTSGEMASEVFTLSCADSSTTPISNIALGCGTDDQSTTFNGADGLVGLGQGPLSLVSQLAAGNIINHAFSYCLVDYYSATTQTSPLVLGSTGTVAKSYTPLLTNTISPSFSSWYYVNLVGITVNSQPISYPSETFAIDGTTGNGGIIVDSGTTYTALFDAALSPLERAISSLVTYPQLNLSSPDFSSLSFNLCYNTTNVPSPVFPTVVFQFDNVDVTLGLNNTFLQGELNGVTFYCFVFTSVPKGQFTSIYGNVQQSHFEISFDVANQRVGFGPGAC